MPQLKKSIIFASEIRNKPNNIKNMKKIEFFNASDVEQFVDFATENELSYQESEDGLEWIVEDEVANKIQEAHPFFDYWNIETV